MNIIIRTFAGFEEILAEEVFQISGLKPEIGKRAVYLKGGIEVVYKLNLWSRLALDVLVELHKYKAANESELYKGAYEYTTHFEGLAGHSSQPHKGVSAVEFAARYANKLIELREELKKKAPKDSIFDPPFSTLQVGGIFGGIAHNVIADKCHINWETRPVIKEDGVFLNNEIDKYANEILLPEMKKVFSKSSIKKEIIGEVIGFDRVKKSEACELVSSLTGDNSREVVSFGTEAGLFQEIGISTVVCGPGSIEQAHKVDEFIELNELKKCLSFLNGIKSISISN